MLVGCFILDFNYVFILIIGMFDKDKSGTIDINEFQQLYNYVNQWLETFRSYDRDQSGHIEEQELAQGTTDFVYNFHFHLQPIILKVLFLVF